MPVLTKKKQVTIPSGMQCDVCSKRDEQGLNTFAIDHTLGYDSPMDMTRITAAICDACLLEILLDKAPGAVFTSQVGGVTSHGVAAIALSRYRKTIST